MEYIDLRSDTVTKPSPEMRKAMAEAEVGDDVWGDDPTVNLLQEKVAEMCHKEAALFVPSGTMANTVSILAQTGRGDEILVEKESHTFNYECGAPAQLGGVQIHPIPGVNGILEPEDVQENIRDKNDVHVPNTALIILENTHNRGGGKIYPLEKLKAIRKTAIEHKIPMHMDGARLWNAVVATGHPIHEYAAQFDSLMFCLSKGLGAPIGSIVIGSKDFIHRAHGYRKMLGGGMRQVGILAAAGLYALEHNIDRLAEDHANAKILATAAAEVPGFVIDPKAVDTNIVLFNTRVSGKTAAQVCAELEPHGVLVIPFGKYLVRAITHLNVSGEQTKKAAQIIRTTFA